LNLKSLFTKRSSEDRGLSKFIQKSFYVTPKKLDYYKVALTHSSILPSKKERVESNERLEFLGDAILDSIVATYLFQHYPQNSEGELTKLKAKLVSRKNLNSMAQSLGVEPFLEFSINAKTHNTSLLGNALEALIGAVYLDLGYRKAQHTVVSLIKNLDIEKLLNDQKDYKSLLYEWAQQFKKSVKFTTLNELKVEGRTDYEVEVIIDNEAVARANASSKKKAQQRAAEGAFKKLNL